MEEEIVSNLEENKDDKKDRKLEELEKNFQIFKNESQLELEKEKSNFLLKIAEFDNTRKRLQKEVEDGIKYANEKLIIKFLDIFDNLDRAIYFAQSSNDFEKLLKGIEMVLSQFNETLEKENVKKIEAQDKEFNPYLHHAISQEENDNYKENTIIEEVRKGYIMGNKVIRPSLVKVSKKGKDNKQNE